MANSTVTFREIRFVIKDAFTECYVLLEAGGDSPLGVQGWHYKVFGPETPIIDILPLFAGDDDPVLWPLKAPTSK